MKAERILGHTLLSTNNCFSVVGNDENSYKIVNFYLETLEGVNIEWPVEIKVLEGHVAVLHDARIPDELYRQRFCEVCCPKHLLPITQRLTHERQIARGQRIEQGDSIVHILGKAP